MKTVITLVATILCALALNAASMSWNAMPQVSIRLMYEGYLTVTFTDPQNKLPDGSMLHLLSIEDMTIEDIVARRTEVDGTGLCLYSTTEIINGKAENSFYEPGMSSTGSELSLDGVAFLILTTAGDYMAGFVKDIPGIETIFVPEVEDEEAGISKPNLLLASGTLEFRSNTVLTDIIPEPNSGLLLLVGSALLLIRRRSLRRSRRC